MSLNDLFQKRLADNANDILFWENYLNELKSLDFNVYANKLKVPALIPIGNRIFFRGEIKHTNEVTVSLGANYFAKCSIQQAEILRQRRIKDAETKLDTFQKEKEYLETQLLFNKTYLENQGQEIIEYYSEEDDKSWRKQHRENVRKYKQGEKKENEQNKEGISDEELWNRLEELELEEELENELNKKEEDSKIIDKGRGSFVINEANLLLNKNKNINEYNNSTVSSKDSVNKTEMDDPEETIIPQSKIDLLQQVIEKQQELESKLSELKLREKPKSKTEDDLVAKVDEMEELDELEDEIDRLDEMLQTRGQNTDELQEDSSPDKTKPVKLKKSISFADEDDSETLEISFKHSKVEPNEEPYNPERGITKPSDLYAAYSNLFNSKTNSILSKKSKYADDISKPESENKIRKKINSKPRFEIPSTEDEDNLRNRAIVLKDVTEKPAVEEKKFDVSVRPSSLFKKKRMQAKSCK